MTIFVVRLTLSQHMALNDLLLEHMRNPEATQAYVNCSTDPATETRPEDLLRRLMAAETEHL